MVVYAFYIFDRHTECIYSKKWPPPVAASTAKPRPQSTSSAATNGESAQPLTRRTNQKSDDEKLVFGVVFSLRNMCRNLGGEDNFFMNFRTNEYKLHYFETLTRLKFVMLTDTRTGNLRAALHQIWLNLYIEYVVKNPLSPAEHPGGMGVANELFERGLESFVREVLSAPS
ncbi:transport protein particle complex subunit [Eremomyces bilateralis CBS 781.70]|uniref:Trafficking protein particle complex subunit n=1 Tax=Eremomyces bilateralis CBS 781.70 TaxID=1392243 RepID=A0A6G1G293_9PEZI|nr:transport protein particle complex subunit [Eremomyces bilateralis CBS 781.70]KAF1812041.1 transport protein particle complex subunit [Eremomyces bilateralis CBS 781.70]